MKTGCKEKTLADDKSPELKHSVWVGSGVNGGLCCVGVYAMCVGLCCVCGCVLCGSYQSSTGQMKCVRLLPHIDSSYQLYCSLSTC